MAGRRRGICTPLGAAGEGTGAVEGRVGSCAGAFKDRSALGREAPFPAVGAVVGATVGDNEVSGLEAPAQQSLLISGTAMQPSCTRVTRVLVSSRRGSY